MLAQYKKCFYDEERGGEGSKLNVLEAGCWVSTMPTSNGVPGGNSQF